VVLIFRVSFLVSFLRKNYIPTYTEWDWTYYEMAAKINTEDGPVRVAHLLNVIGKDGQDMFDTFSLSEIDQKDIVKVLQAFETRCTPITNVIYERYIFNK